MASWPYPAIVADLQGQPHNTSGHSRTGEESPTIKTELVNYHCHSRNPACSSLMSSTAQQKHLGVEDLSGDVPKVLIECGKQLKSAPFKDNGKFEVIDDRTVMEEASRGFVGMQSTKVRACAISIVNIC